MRPEHREPWKECTERRSLLTAVSRLLASVCSGWEPSLGLLGPGTRSRKRETEGESESRQERSWVFRCAPLSAQSKQHSLEPRLLIFKPHSLGVGIKGTGQEEGKPRESWVGSSSESRHPPLFTFSVSPDFHGDSCFQSTAQEQIYFYNQMLF